MNGLTAQSWICVGGAVSLGSFSGLFVFCPLTFYSPVFQVAGRGETKSVANGEFLRATVIVYDVALSDMHVGAQLRNAESSLKDVA